MSTQNTPPLIVGIVEGLFAPIGELFLVLIFTVGIQIVEGVRGDASILYLAFVLIVIIDFVRNIFIGLHPSWFAAGHAGGSIFGIILFYAVLNNISPEAANQSLLLTIVLVASFIVGVFLMIYRRNNT